jgi:hypothetical protein
MTEGSIDDGRFASIVSSTHGVRSDICTSNWAADLQTISRSVFGARRGFDLSSTPRSMADIMVSINGVPNSAWTWDSLRNVVLFTAPPPPGAMVSVDYRTACF